MNILILAVGSYGDVLPLLGLGKEFSRRSHNVTFFTNGYFSSLIQRAGLKFVAIGSAEAYDQLADNLALWHPHKGWQLIMKELASPQLREAYRILCGHVTPQDTLLISSTLGFAARLLQDTHQVPHVTVHFSPGVFHSAHSPPRMPNLLLPDWLPIWFKQGCWSLINHMMIDPLVKPSLNTLRRELGLSPVSKVFQNWAHSPELVLGMFPHWFAPPQPDWPLNTTLTGFPLYDEVHDAALPESVRTFLTAHPQPLVFTPGSANKHGKTFFKEAAEACRQLDRPGILLTRYPEQLPPSLPHSVQHFFYTPLSRLLPHCSALIHHGGIGTCSQALKAGIPQLIQPLAFDQFDNAARLRKLGVGGMIPARSFRSPTLTDRLRTMLASPKIQMNCRQAAQRLKKANGLPATCDAIEARFIKRKA